MMRHHTNTLAPPPPSPDMAQSPAYAALPASAKALLLLIEIEVQGGPIAVIDICAACGATGMRKAALRAALDQLAAAGFIVASVNGRFCVIAPSSRWRT
jgi:hypothetical protein